MSSKALRTVYVYFKAPFNQAQAVQQAAQLQLAEIAAAYGLSGMLQRRAELVSVEGYQTWLEVYSAVPINIDLKIFSQPHGGLGKLLVGARHVEVFIDA